MSDKDAILSNWCQIPFCTLLSREIIQLCWTRNKIEINNSWPPGQELSNDVSYVGLSQNFIISTCLRFEVWDGVISPEGVHSCWYSKSEISKSRAFQWYITCMIIWKVYNLYMFKVWGLRWYNFSSTCPIMVIFKFRDLQVTSFPMMYHMYVYLNFL